jgi:glycosyltransferase involved in cell wall biosynthesis
MHDRYYPKVTIGIPTYNRADGYLKQTLESALNQTYQNLEIIVADNCSTDNTKIYVNSISDPRIRYFRHNKNIQPNDNFNFCVEQAKGDYFLLLHDDDLIDDDFVETCMNSVYHNTDIGIILTGTRTIDGSGNVLNKALNRTKGLSTTDFILSWFKWKTAWYFCSILFNTKRLKEIGGFGSKKNLFQDAVAGVQLAAKFGKIDIHDMKASFRKHGSERTFAIKVDEWMEDSLYLLDLICALIPENRSLLRKEGLAYFSRFNYNLAKKVKSPIDRFMVYLKLTKTFKLIFIRQILTQLISGTSIYSALRSFKKRFLQSDNE